MATTQAKELWRSTCTRQCALSSIMFGIVISYRTRLEYRQCSQQPPGANQLPPNPIRASPDMVSHKLQAMCISPSRYSDGRARVHVPLCSPRQDGARD